MPYKSVFIQPAVDTLAHIGEGYKYKVILTAILSYIAYAINENVVGLGVLLGFIIIDWITGIIAAVKHKEFSSYKFRKTIIKAAMYFMIIGLFHSLEKVNILLSYIQLDIAVMTYLAVTEVISIIENTSRITTLKLPSWILDKLKVFQQTGQIDVATKRETVNTERELVNDNRETANTNRETLNSDRELINTNTQLSGSNQINTMIM